VFFFCSSETNVLSLVILHNSEGLGKVRLFVRVRKQGCRIESVPLRRLLKLVGFRKKRWEFRDGWLILEGF
jgi:hypothetical protein